MRKFIRLPWSYAVLSTENLAGVTMYTDGILLQLLFHYRTNENSFIVPVTYWGENASQQRTNDFEHVSDILKQV